MGINDNNDGAGYPLFTFVDENLFKKETFLGKCMKSELSFFIERNCCVKNVWIDVISSHIPPYCLPVWSHPPPRLPFRVKLLHLLIISLWRTVACCIEHAEFTALGAETCSSITTGFFQSSYSWKLLKNASLGQFFSQDVSADLRCVSCCPHTEELLEDYVTVGNQSSLWGSCPWSPATCFTAPGAFFRPNASKSTQNLFWHFFRPYYAGFCIQLS